MGTEASEDGVIWDGMLPADLPAGLTMGETEAAEIGVYVADALGEGGAALGGATLRLGLHNTTAADELAVSLNGTPRDLGAALCVWLATCRMVLVETLRCCQARGGERLTLSATYTSPRFWSSRSTAPPRPSCCGPASTSWT